MSTVLIVKKNLTTFAVNYFDCQLSDDEALLMLAAVVGWSFLAVVHIAALLVAYAR